MKKENKKLKGSKIFANKELYMRIRQKQKNKAS